MRLRRVIAIISAAAGACSASVAAGQTTLGPATWTSTGTGTSTPTPSDRKWNVGANWSSGPAYPSGVGAVASFNGATATRGIAFVDSITLGTLNVNHDTAGNFTTRLTGASIVGGGALTFDEVGTGPAHVNVFGTGQGTLELQSVTLNDDVIFAVDQTNASSTAGALQFTAGLGGNGGMTKTGDGLATMSNSNKTYAGATNITGGRLRVSSAGLPTNTSSVTVNGGQLTLTTDSASYTFGATAAVPVNLQGAGPATGLFASSPGVLRQDTNIATTITNTVNLTGAATVHVQGSASGVMALSGQIIGSGPLTLTAASSDANLGTYVLSNAANSYTGGTVLNGGTLDVTTGALGAGPLTINTNPISGINSTVLLNSATGTTTGTLSGTNASGGTITINNQGGTYTVNQTAPAIAPGTITGNGGFTLGAASTATLTFAISNSYTGLTSVAGGTLSVKTAGTLGSGDVAVHSTATKLDIQPTFSAGNAIANAAALSVADGVTPGVVSLAAGVNEVVGGLVLGGVTQTVSGTYGSSASSATFKDNRFFSGTGVVTLTLGRTLYWDVNRGSAAGGGTTPSGAWDGSTINFNTDSTGGIAGTQSATTLSTDPVIFTAGSSGAGNYAVSVTGTQNVASLAVARGSVTITGGAVANVSGTFNIAADATAAITSDLPSANVNKTGAGKLIVSRLAEHHTVNIAAGTLEIADSSPKLPADPAGDNAFVSRPLSLSIANNGAPLGKRVYTAALDLGNNDLIIDYTGASPAASIEDMVRSGFNGGNWQGMGVTSSTAASVMAAGTFALAVADNNLLTNKFGDGTGGKPQFDGLNVDNTTVLVKFTHRIDLDLDGLVTPNDAIIFATNYIQDGNAKWITGDVDYDGKHTQNDAIIFATFYNPTLPPLPEPGAVGWLSVLAAPLLRRRR